MTDLEMTKLCAEAMEDHVAAFDELRTARYLLELGKYDPLHDDAQAMALVKKLRLSCLRVDGVDLWLVSDPDYDGYAIKSDDLNRAIVECAAKLARAKSASPAEPPNAPTVSQA